MATAWLLLLLVVSSQSVDSQPTTDDDKTCDGDELPTEQQTDVERIVENQQQLFQAIMNRLDVVEKYLSFVTKPRDCSEILNNFGERSDGVYTVYPGKTQRGKEVYCDMTSDGGGWTVFQRRKDGSEDFYRNWADYAAGFGNLTAEFWLGNDNLHLLTSCGQRLRVDLADFEGNTRYAEYDNFRVDSAGEKYRLVSLGTYSGTAGDSLIRHLGDKFSTRDEDNDVWLGGSCSVKYKGAWWYDDCHRSNLNGLYLGGNHSSLGDGVEWFHWTGHQYSLRFTEMKIRPFQHA